MGLLVCRDLLSAMGASIRLDENAHQELDINF